MAQTLTTVATFHLHAQAELAKNVLTDAGIPAVVADSEIVAMDWLLANAVGGIKVQVRSEDAERAAGVLDRTLGDAAGLASEELDDEELGRQAVAADPEPDDAPEEPAPEPDLPEEEPAPEPDPAGERSDYARQLLFVAWIGLVFPPFIFYAFYVMLNALFGPGALSPRGWLNLLVGGAITVLGLTFWFVALNRMARPEW